MTLEHRNLHVCNVWSVITHVNQKKPTQRFVLIGVLVAALVASIGLIVGAPQAASAATICSDSACQGIPSTKKEVAQLLVQMADTGSPGRLTTSGYPSLMSREIRPIAAGNVDSQCDVSLQSLQTVAIVVKKFGSANVTDLNRWCADDPSATCGHANESPVHCVAVPTIAVDFDRVGGLGAGVTMSQKLLSFASQFVPAGTWAENNCESASYPNITRFPSSLTDPCTHQHIDFRGTGGENLNIPNGSTGNVGPAVFQLHSDGAMYAYTGQPCTSSGCAGWAQINGAGSHVVQTVADNGLLYILRDDGAIFQYNGNPCSGGSCLGWTQLNGINSNTVQITAEAGALWLLRNDGAIFKYTGQPCAATCSGWQQYNGNGSQATKIVAGTNSAGVPVVNMLRSDGAIFQSTAPCGTTCAGWAMINGANSLVTAMTARGKDLFILRSDEAIFQYTQQACSANVCAGWAQINGSHSGAVEISAGANATGMSVVNMRRNDGAIFQYTGQVCSGGNCTGWAMINGANSLTVQMTGSDSNLFIRRSDGAIFQYTQQACTANGCAGWAQLDGNVATSQIAG